MAKRPNLPSPDKPAGSAAPPTRAPRERVARAPRIRRPRRTVDVRGWLGGIRLSAFMLIMLGLAVLAVLVLVPTIGTYMDQRQRIAALAQAVAVSEEKVAALQAERDRWQDPAYITTQARERLYYVLPGEVAYLIDNDLDPATLPTDQTPVSATVQEAGSDWMTHLLRSVTAAGLAHTAVSDAEYTIGVPDPQPIPTP